MTITTALMILQAILLVPGILGLFVMYHLFREQRSPADESNRINKIRLLWFALTREDLFVTGFSWLMNDEQENMS